MIDKFITSKNIEHEDAPGFIREVNDLKTMVETVKVGKNHGFYLSYDTTNQDGILGTIVKYFDAMPSKEELIEIRKDAERQFKIFF